MDQQALSKLKQSFADAESIGIAVTQNPSIDEMGAALALFLSLKAANKKVAIASPTEPIVELSSLVGIDQVKNSLISGAAGDLVVSFPYREGEIEKVSYTLENGQLNIVVKAGELGLNFSDDEVKFVHGSTGTLTHLVVIGAPSLNDIGPLFNPEEMRDISIINIDINPENQGYGEVVMVSPRLSSVSEQMSEILLSSGMPMDVDIAQNLLSGISYATTNFQDPKTSFMAFEMAGELMRLGAIRMPVIAPTASQMASIPTPRPQARYTAADDYTQPQQPSYPQRQQPQQRVQMPQQQQQRQQQAPRPVQQPQQRVQMPQQRQQPQQRVQMPQQQQQRQQQAPRPVQQPQQQPSRTRQDEIREELARAAAQQATGQQFVGEPINNEPVIDEPQERPQTNGRPQNPPADWLTPKVYKGSSDVNN